MLCFSTVSHKYQVPFNRLDSKNLWSCLSEMGEVQIAMQSLKLWNRWAGLAAALMIQACGGLTYTFAVYSEHLKEKLDYDQEDIDDIGAAKDFGYCLGIIGGLLYNFYPPWLTVSLGASIHFTGYFLVWMTVTERISPPFWLLCSFIGLGVGGDSWVDTACVITSLQNFANHRGTTMGILKAQIGLSGAVFVAIYKAFLKPNVDAFVLLIATGPFVISIVFAIVIRPFSSAIIEEESESVDTRSRFQLAYGMTTMLALFLLCTITFQTMFDVSKLWLICVAVITILHVTGLSSFMVLYKPVQLFFSLWRAHRMPSSGNKPSREMVYFDSVQTKEENTGNEFLEDDTLPLKKSCNVVFDDLDDLSGDTRSPDHVLSPEQSSKGIVLDEREDACQQSTMVDKVTFRQCLGSLNFWLLTFITMTGPGSGLAVINNFGQLGKALETEKIELFVGLVSIWSCLGRLAAGYGSDLLLRLSGYPRTVCLIIAHLIMSIGCLCLAAGYVPLLYLGSALIGGSYGAFWSVSPAVISEVFGLHNFAALYKIVGACGPVGAYLLSAKLVGYMYDEEVLHSHSQLRYSSWTDDDFEHTCYGRRCFGYSLSIIAAVCVLGACVGVILSLRTSKLYASIRVSYQQ